MLGAGVLGVRRSHHDFVGRVFVIVVCLMVLQACFCAATLPDAKVGYSDPSAACADSAVVRSLSALESKSYGIPGLSHLTIAGAVHHGMKEVEMWIQTLAPGASSPVHRHDCEEVLLILEGKGTLSLAPSTDLPYPGKPREHSFERNSTVTIPVNAVHQVGNYEEVGDLHVAVVISPPPLHPYTYKDWFTPHVEAEEMFPFAWDAELRVSPGDQCGETLTEGFQQSLVV